MSTRHELTDEQWAVIEPLLPKPKPGPGRPPADPRKTLNGILYVLANNGLLDAYNLRTGEEIYRQRLPLVGSGFSASPIASDGKIYLCNEDGEMLVISAGEKFAHVATNSI